MTLSNRLAEIIASHKWREGPLLPILNDIQAEFGYVNDDAKLALAKALNLSRAEIHGVVSFYHDYHEKPANLPIVKLCGAEACQARGSDALIAEISEFAKGKCAIETVYCLGLCSVGPNAIAGGDVYARLDVPALTQMIKDL
ncbi:formate dehydrogenase gamma subunit [Parasphingorhabdus marina DSM 22363]|uniref:Formate dehydrogenase gamma subunit n=1 Tax=Parasphingorhabdus marina DSM 22363 TaxID=1123272 RepID=A0A1N6D9Q0_9SPHN|nr:NAD(P)H-dependent oxidoreductase subunit E [Parasphingorhabdus marina]SIN67457.1 formate dehydrogenase gamma subunit [Parasphingorhabdus marina DSM 22363]